MRYFNELMETLPRRKMRLLQSERLYYIVSKLYKSVPFYRRLLDEKGIRPHRIKNIKDIAQLPFTAKSDLREQYPFGLLAIKRDSVARIHCSSGTSGKPTIVCYSKKDLAIFAEVVARSLVAAGCQPGWILQNAYGYGLFTGGLGLHGGAEKLGMNVIPVSGGMTDRQLMLMQDMQSDAICCTPSYAQTLAEEVQKRGISPKILNLKTAILGAEPWTETIRHQVEKGLGLSAVNIYGLSEIIGPGVSCEDFEEKTTGSYIWEDHFFPEVVDKDTGEPLKEGQQGVLVFTTLTKQAMPLLRYRTGDICSLSYAHSKKRTHIKMSPIAGRADDMLIIRGVNVFPTQVEDVLRDIEHISPHYQLVVIREGAMDEMELKVEVSLEILSELNEAVITPELISAHEALMRLQHSVTRKIKENIGISVKVTLKEQGSIPRSEGGKLTRVIDLRIRK